MYRTQETKRGVRQYTCVANDDEKVKLLESRKKEVGANWQRAVSGEVFAVPVISKLVSPPGKIFHAFGFLRFPRFLGCRHLCSVLVVARRSERHSSQVSEGCRLERFGK